MYVYRYIYDIFLHFAEKKLLLHLTRKEQMFTAGLLADVVGFLDRSFNANGLVGLLQAAFDFDIEVREQIAKDKSTNKNKLRQFVKEKTNVVGTLGIQFADDTLMAAQKAPKTKFAAIDVVYTRRQYKSAKNLRGVSFASQEAAFLAGYLAAGMTKTGIVATYGGENIAPVTVFINGYASGVQYYNEQHGVSIKVLGTDLFVGNFTSIETGRQFAIDLIAAGADIIFPVAGPVGLGTAQYCFESQKALFIGVDSDWFITALDYHSIILSSVLKRIDTAVYDAVSATFDKSFTGGQKIYNLANNGVDLAPYHDFETVVPTSLKVEIASVKQGIINGTIPT
jgi:basic membrane protein A